MDHAWRPVRLLADTVSRDVPIVYDATSAYAHKQHAAALEAAGKTCVDMTPAALGPYVVPTVKLDLHTGTPDLNLVSCGGQATIPIVAAINAVASVEYAEIVSTIASKSAGPGTRQNIDEFTETTARGLEVVGGARKGKACAAEWRGDSPSTLCLADPAVPSSSYRVRVLLASRVASARPIVAQAYPSLLRGP